MSETARTLDEVSNEHQKQQHHLSVTRPERKPPTASTGKRSRVIEQESAGSQGRRRVSSDTRNDLRTETEAAISPHVQAPLIRPLKFYTYVTR